MHIYSNSEYLFTESYSGYNKILRLTINVNGLSPNKAEVVESLIVNTLLENLDGNHMSFESVVRIIIIIIDKGLRIVVGFLLQGHFRWPK